MRQQVRFAICITAIAVATCLQAQVAKNPKETSPQLAEAKLPPWQDAKKYLNFLIPATVNAARIVAASGDPLFKQGVTIQEPSPEPAAVAIFFINEAGFPEKMRPSVRHSPCQVLPLQGSAKLNAKYLIACNPDFLRKLDVLIRVAHSTQFINAQMRNDWKLMQLLKRIENDPAQVMAEANPVVSDDHINEHMSFLLAFLLAHESWHLQQSTSSSFSDSPALNLQPDGDLDSRIMCRNYEEFARHGIQLDTMKTDHPAPLKDEGTTQNAEDRAYFEQSRAIWREELEADRYGARVIADTILTLHAKVKLAEQDTQRVYLETIENFALLMFTLWHGRLQPFADQNCSGYAGRDFYMTLCMCQHKDLYQRAIQLFGATHPPIVLRMHLAANEFTEKLVTNKDLKAMLSGSGRDLASARIWGLAMDAMIDSPLKLAWPACMNEITRLLDKDAKIVQILPDLAGLLGPHPSKFYPGYPANEAELQEKCIPVPPEHELPKSK